MLPNLKCYGKKKSISQVLGRSVETNLTIDHRGFSFYIREKMLNLFEASLNITSGYENIKVIILITI